MERVEEAIVDMVEARAKRADRGEKLQELIVACGFQKTVDIEKELESRGLTGDLGVKVEHMTYNNKPQVYLEGFRRI